MLNTKKIISAIKLDRELLSPKEQEEAAIILCHALRTYRDPEPCATREVEDLLCVFDERKCRICGCTDDNACPGGCYWIEEDLCSACADLVDQIVRASVPVYDVLLERAKQIKKYGFDADHDDKWAHSELKYAAAVYLKDDPIFNYWPWRDFPYQGKKDTERQRLITAAALIIAEIERLDRAEDNKEEQQ